MNSRSFQVVGQRWCHGLQEQHHSAQAVAICGAPVHRPCWAQRDQLFVGDLYSNSVEMGICSGMWAIALLEIRRWHTCSWNRCRFSRTGYIVSEAWKKGRQSGPAKLCEQQDRFSAFTRWSFETPQFFSSATFSIHSRQQGLQCGPWLYMIVR